MRTVLDFMTLGFVTILKKKELKKRSKINEKSYTEK